MAAKSTDRPLMRQKVNVNPVLIKKWVDDYKFDIRQMIHGSLLEVKDLGTKFEHQDREFEIVGMGQGRTVMLRETRGEGVFYWECTRHFAQMMLGRLNQEFVNLIGDKTTLVDIEYTEAELLLAPRGRKRRTKPEEEVEVVKSESGIVLDTTNDEDDEDVKSAIEVF